MALIQPLALILLGAGLVPLLIHLLVRRRGRRVEFPTLQFLAASPARRLAFGRLSHPALLAARIAMIAVLALLLARPYGTGTAAQDRITSVVVLDESLSLQAAGSGEAARQAARAALTQMDPDQRVALVMYRGTAHVVAQLDSPAAVLQALESALAAAAEQRADPGSAHGAAALHALDLLQGTLGRRELIWISDFRGEGFDELRRRAAQSGIAWASVAVAQEAHDNDAPAAVRMEQGGSHRLRLWVDCFNADGARGEEVSWELQGPAPQNLRGALSDGRGVHVRISSEGPDHRVAVALEPGDALAPDDAASFRLTARAALRFAVLGPDSELLVHALESAVGVDGLGLQRVTPEQADLLAVSDLASAGRDVEQQVAAARSRGAALVLGAVLRSDGVERRLADIQVAGLEGLLPVAAHRRPRLESVALAEQRGTGVLARFEDGSPAMTRRSAGAAEITVGFPLTGPPRGPGLEDWFPALVEGLVLELVPQAMPAFSRRSPEARRESALTAPVPPRDSPVMATPWVDPVALEQETGWALPLAGLLLAVALVEGVLARRASSVRP